MTQIISDLLRKICEPYVDDLVVFSKRKNRPHRKFTQGLRKVKKTSIEDKPEKICIRDRART